MFRALGVALAVLALAGAAYMGVVVVGQIHHDNGCSQYANALRGALSDPEMGPPAADLKLLTPTYQESVRKSVTAFQQSLNLGQPTSAQQEDWSRFSDQFIAAALATNGC